MTIAVPDSLGLAGEDVRSILALARAAAPGVRFEVRPEQIELHTTSPHTRETRLACGTALLNVRLALQGHGIRPLVTLLPGPSAHDAAAAVRLGGYQEPSPDVLALLRTLHTQTSNRRTWTTFPELASWRGLLSRAAEVERAWLHVKNGAELVLCTFNQGAAAEIRAGQAMQRVVLTAGTVGIAVHPSMDPISLSALRADLRPCLGNTLVPQMVLRLGAG
ncbi:hypothetical protein UK23_32020 [Lentzea aerocolonigenes]|uniref:Uncharacterized protein n=1 Tax=Lentzea aerocolonigenes TaxID=68170 RepID=A0A0F0GJK5_LENAE|nr:hypothetical protein [Lentzea aerocolonigenes]KJK43719.1 hypothetical protein UK23_32020 [Lentzea aerocolonigenes]